MPPEQVEDEVHAEMEPVSPAAPRLQMSSVLTTLRSWSAVVFLGVAPTAAVIALLALAIADRASFLDFATFWHTGRLIAHGVSPYPSLDSLPAVAHRATFSPFVYPPPAAFAMVPLSLLPFAVANIVFLIIGLACVALSLRLLDVRDWRCYGAAFFSPPVLAAALNGAVSLLLLLGVAAAWRYRRRTVVLGTLVAGLIVLKLFLWPLWLWLLCTRRFVAAGLSFVITCAVTVGSWAVIGFAGMRHYPHLLGRLTELVGPKSYSLYALERAAGAPERAAHLGLVVVGLLLLLAAGSVLENVDRDRRVFVAALGGSLLLTPILWPHYLVLLLVPIALARVRLSGLWLLPLALWFDAEAWSDGRPERIVPVLALSAIAVVLTLRPPTGRRAPSLA